jgi:porin
MVAGPVDTQAGPMGDPGDETFRETTRETTRETVGETVLEPATTWPTLNSLLKSPPWLDLGLTIQSDGLGNPMGGIRKTTNWIQQTTLDASFSRGFGKEVALWKEADHWKGHVQLTLFSGKAGYGQSIGSAFSLTASDHPTGLWLTEATVSRAAGKGEVDLKAGVFSLNPGFIEAPVLNAYMNSVLNNTLNLNVTGFAINPFIAPGIELRWRPGSAGQDSGDLGPYGEWRYGAFLLNPQNALASLFGANPGQPQINGSAQLVQWSFDRLPGAKRVAQPIKRGQQVIARQLPPPLLQIGGGYLNDRTNNNITPGVASTLTLAVPAPLGFDNRLWLGLSRTGESANNPSPLFVGAGWLSQGAIPGRPLDVLALGLGRTSLNRTVNPGLNPESLLELNYSAVINSTLTLQPFLQWVINPGGTGTTPNILALGLELQLQF